MNAGVEGVGGGALIDEKGGVDGGTGMDGRCGVGGTIAIGGADGTGGDSEGEGVATMGIDLSGADFDPTA